MKHFFTAFILVFLIPTFTNAQDTIVLNSGKKILAKHIHIRKKLYYKDYPSLMPDSMEKAQVNYVIHQSGWKIPMIDPPWYNPITFSPGIGVSTVQFKFKSVFTDTGAGIISESPVCNFAIDYSIKQKISIGIAISWQSLQFNPYESYHDSIKYNTTSGYYYTYYPNYPWGGMLTSSIKSPPPKAAPNTDIVERLTRFNMGIRVLYHIRNDDVIDFYIGARLGLSFWTDQSNPAGYNTAESSTAQPSIQGLIGFRREIMNHLGAYLEAGLGSPYFANGGIYYKIATKKHTK